MDHVIGGFKNYLSVTGYSMSTQRALSTCVREFLCYGHVTDVTLITSTAILDFYEWLQVRPLRRREGVLSGMMINHYLYALRVFFDWQQHSGAIAVHPMSHLKFRREARNGREPLSPAAIQALFAVASTLREQVLLHLFYSCGLRRSEAVRLRLPDVYPDLRLLYVRNGKGDRRRVIPLTGRVARVLRLYIAGEQPRCRLYGTAFMLNNMGGPMYGSRYLQLFKQLLCKASLSNHYTLHHLRHSIATHLLQGGMSLEYVRAFLGHQYLESTQIYTTASSDQLRRL